MQYCRVCAGTKPDIDEICRRILLYRTADGLRPLEGDGSFWHANRPALACEDQGNDLSGICVNWVGRVFLSCNLVTSIVDSGAASMVSKLAASTTCHHH